MAVLWITGKRAVMQAETAWAHTRARTRVRTASLSRELWFAGGKLLGVGRGGVFQASVRNGALGKLGRLNSA